ncbi:MAG: hypothetical protein WKG07_26765 [Hymenobacter sp.]
MASAQSLAAQQALDSIRARYHPPALLAAVTEPGRIRYVQSWRAAQRPARPRCAN